MGWITSLLIFIVQEDSAVKKCQPRECFERMYKRVEDQATLGPGAQLGGAPPSLIKGGHAPPLRSLAPPVGGGGKK